MAFSESLHPDSSELLPDNYYILTFPVFQAGGNILNKLLSYIVSVIFMLLGSPGNGSLYIVPVTKKGFSADPKILCVYQKTINFYRVSDTYRVGDIIKVHVKFFLHLERFKYIEVNDMVVFHDH